MSCARTYFNKMENSLIRNFHFFAWHMAATFNDFPGETYIIGGYPILQCRKKNWQIPKYRGENRRNTKTVFIDRSRLREVVSISNVCLSSMYTPLSQLSHCEKT